jgi:hypothetical protein
MTNTGLKPRMLQVDADEEMKKSVCIRGRGRAAMQEAEERGNP